MKKRRQTTRKSIREMVELNRNTKLGVAHTTQNYKEVLEQSEMCGCCYCGRIFNKKEFTDDDWVVWGFNPFEDETKKDKTLLCPYCGINAVVGDAVVKPTPALLRRMYRLRFC